MITCKFENGNDATLRHVVVDIIVLKDNKVLLVKRNEKLTEGGKWGLVGGYAEHDETVHQAAHREILEETGYVVDELQLLWINDNPKRPREHNRQNIAFVFYCNAQDKEGKSDWEVDAQKWYPFDALPPEEEIAFDHIISIKKYQQMKQGEKITVLK